MMVQFEVSSPNKDGVRKVTANKNGEIVAELGYIAYDHGWWEGSPSAPDDEYIYRCTTMGAVLDCLIENVVDNGVMEDYY